MFWLVGILLIPVLITVLYLRPQNLARFDLPPGESFDRGQKPGQEHEDVLASLAVGVGPVRRAPRRERLALMRQYMDNLSENQEYSAEICPVDAGGVSAEWILAPGVDTSRRVLYIHGGAFVMGSPRSHRNITSRFSQVANAAVLAIDYRLMPENSRMAGIVDCRSAYQWLLQHGPQGESPVERVFVGGDSAGGNLALTLIAWLRDENLRPPDAVVSLSPVTDGTFGSPSVKHNIPTDAMLGPMFKRFIWLPGPLIWWATWIQNRIPPNNPLVSPVFGDLSGLPPTLVHASESEILFDDARRYVNRAAAAGSPVQLQSWPHMVHVWHMFYPQLTEACDAWDEIGNFIAQVEAERQARVNQ